MMVLGLGVAACSAEPPGPSAAVLELALDSPAEDDGAVLLTIRGGPIDSVEAPGFRLYSTSLDPASHRLILTGPLTTGPIALIHIPDQNRTADYSATVDQVAARDYSQRDPAGYALRLTP